MLTAIGAGATSSSTIDWHDVWVHSPEAAKLEDELDHIHTEGRSRPPVEAEYHKEFATPWPYQLYMLLRRDWQAHWRNPTYLLSKIVLNITSGLFIGFTFFKSKDSIQGTQNKLFVSLCSICFLYIMADRSYRQSS